MREIGNKEKLVDHVLKTPMSYTRFSNLSYRTLHQQFESYKQEVRRIGVETRRQQTQQKDDAPTCGICRKTKFADGCGHLCSYCQTKFCARCGGRVSLRSNNVRILNSKFLLFTSLHTHLIPAVDNTIASSSASVLCLYAFSSCFLAHFEETKVSQKNGFTPDIGLSKLSFQMKMRVLVLWNDYELKHLCTLEHKSTLVLAFVLWWYCICQSKHVSLWLCCFSQATSPGQHRKEQE